MPLPAPVMIMVLSMMSCSYVGMGREAADPKMLYCSTLGEKPAIGLSSIYFTDQRYRFCASCKMLAALLMLVDHN